MLRYRKNGNVTLCCRNFCELSAHFTQHSGSIQAAFRDGYHFRRTLHACAQMPPFLASSSARPQAAALRDIRDARVARVRDMRPEQSDPAQPMAVLGIQGRGKQRRKAQRKLH